MSSAKNSPANSPHKSRPKSGLFGLGRIFSCAVGIGEDSLSIPDIGTGLFVTAAGFGSTEFDGPIGPIVGTGGIIMTGFGVAGTVQGTQDIGKYCF